MKVGIGKVEKVKHRISKEIQAMKVVIHKDKIQSGNEEEQV